MNSYVEAVTAAARCRFGDVPETSSPNCSWTKTPSQTRFGGWATALDYAEFMDSNPNECRSVQGNKGTSTKFSPTRSKLEKFKGGCGKYLLCFCHWDLACLSPLWKQAKENPQTRRRVSDGMMGKNAVPCRKMPGKNMTTVTNI